MPDIGEKEICTVCKKEKSLIIKERKFDKCRLCAKSEKARKYKVFIDCLSPEQKALLDSFYEARDDFAWIVVNEHD